MNRILEFSPSLEEAVVSRVLVLIHQAVDEAFPHVTQNNRQFTKTVFSADGEATAIGRPAGDDSALNGRPAFAVDEDTANDFKPSAALGETAGAAHTAERSFADVVTPPPGNRPAPTKSADGPTLEPANHAAKRTEHPPRPTAASGNAQREKPARQPRAPTENRSSAATNLDATMDGLDRNDRPDWVSRVLVGVFLAGIILLAYSLFVAP